MRVYSLLVLAAPLAVVAAEESKVDAVFAEYARPGSPGCAVGVQLRGKNVLAKGYGLADLEHDIALSPQSRFYMASVSKQFTAMALLLAEKEGKLRLDDSVRKFIPELPAYADGITFRRMLDHTAGLRDYLALWAFRGFSNESVLRDEASLALIARQQALNFPTGTDYDYSNSGYLLSAIALERATGKPLETYARDHIFAPLEMHATRFQHNHADPIPNRAHGHARRRGQWQLADVNFDVIGSGGMYSNVEDMLRWARNFDAPAVGADVLAALITPGKLIDGRPTPGGYALGIIARDGALSHAGGASGYSTYFLRKPADALTVVCLCNIGGAPVARLAEEVAAIYTGRPRTEPAKAAAPASISNAAPPAPLMPGVYWSEELETVWRVVKRSGGLQLEYDGPPTPITVAGGHYRAAEFSLTPVSDTVFTASLGRAKGIRFVRR